MNNLATTLEEELQLERTALRQAERRLTGEKEARAALQSRLEQSMEAEEAMHRQVWSHEQHSLTCCSVANPLAVSCSARSTYLAHRHPTCACLTAAPARQVLEVRRVAHEDNERCHHR